MLALPVLTLCLALVPAEPAASQERKPPLDTYKPDPAWKPLGPALWFDAKDRKLILRARVAMRQGALEHLLCATNSKEHESILATDAPAWQIHAGLLATGAEVGHPVRFRPKFEPPAGTAIRLDLEWDDHGQTRRAEARDWVMDARTKKSLEIDWVFAGSEFYTDPETKKERYAANEGDLFTVANFTSAILDLPLASSDSDTDRLFVAYTARIPPEGTYVTVILRPREPKPKP